MPSYLAYNLVAQAQTNGVELSPRHPIAHPQRVLFERLKSLIDVSLLAGLDATLKWMLNAGILLRTRPMNPSIDPKIVGEEMGKPLFAIQNVDYRSDIMVITKGSD